VSLLWAIPGVVVVAGLVAMSVLLRDVDAAATELRGELGRLEELRAAVRDLRTEVRAR
jgi:hypothetical protein